VTRRRGEVVVTGSVAFDYLMKFPGRFLEHFLPDHLNRISVSFLVDEMRRVPGGCAPNIAYTLALLGERPRILAAAGKDAREYRDWLSRQGIEVSSLRVFEDVFTASFFVSTDTDQNQIASFYTGAMAKASELSLADLGGGPIAYVIVSPNDPAAMERYVRECRQSEIAYLYDPSQQVARLTGENLREGMRGAAVLICNEYEYGVIRNKTGLAERDIRGLVSTLIVTRGAEGSTIWSEGRRHDVPPALLSRPPVDPTGVGDAYRGALLKGMLRGDSWEFCGRIASVAAAFCLEAEGPQPPRYHSDDFLLRYRESYGEARELSGLFDPVLA
jgi:adenosine kinase